ncbi:hypothetical protein lerEdw1_016689 [Lerista edwardsae]|nr:hypothetical protein lerEdw1_016689 [Lerista edwardsae]
MLTEAPLKQLCSLICFPPFQVNPELVHFFEEKGLKFVGHDTEGKRMEVIELDGKDWFLQCHIYIQKHRHTFDRSLIKLYFLCFWTKKEQSNLKKQRLANKVINFLSFLCYLSLDHPYFIGVQFHPEFSSRPMKPSPAYLGLLLAATGSLDAYLQRGCKLSPR